MATETVASINYPQLITGIIGGLGIFMYGMNQMSGGMQKLAGDRLKGILHLVTANRFVAVIMGIVLTAFVQSSSVSTVMTIGFVNAGLLSLQQALGVILGANIGTTITGWVLVLKIGKYGLPIVGFAILCGLFTKNERFKLRFNTLMGFGFIFYGLDLMSSTLKGIRSNPDFLALFKLFEADTLMGILLVAGIGALTTAIVQSSSATLGITIALATSGAINYETAVALVIGENVGTTITAGLAAIGARDTAKRAALSHFIVNIIGVVWVISIFGPFLNFLGRFSNPTTNITQAIAIAHTLFNVTNVLLFIPFIGLLSKFLVKVIPDDKVQAAEALTNLDERMIDTPAVIISQTKTEIVRSSNRIQGTMGLLREMYANPDEIISSSKVIYETEDDLDKIKREITNISFEIMHKQLSSEEIDETRVSLEVIDELETISDYISRIAKAMNKLEENDIRLTEEKKEALTKLNDDTLNFIKKISNGYENSDFDLLFGMMSDNTELKGEFKKSRRMHLERISSGDIPPLLSTAYMDILNHYKRIRHHSLNIIESLAINR